MSVQKIGGRLLNVSQIADAIKPDKDWYPTTRVVSLENSCNRAGGTYYTLDEIIPITREQMHAFAGNMLLLKSRKGGNVLVMSKTAFDSLTKEQIEILESYAEILAIPVPTIEKVEGGSVRCMIAEIFLKKK